MTPARLAVERSGACERELLHVLPVRYTFAVACDPLATPDSREAPAMTSKTACSVVLLSGLLLSAGCGQTDTITLEQAQDASVFSFDEAAFPGAKPWTSEDFRNDSEDF